MGMTGEVPGAPRKRRRAGSIPAVSTGSEGDGNPPGLGPGQTRFDSGVPDHGSLAQREEHPVEAREVPVRFRGEPPSRTGLTVKTTAFQADNRGSIPRYGSHAPLAQLAEYLALTQGVGDRCPRGARSTGESRNWQTRRLQVPHSAGSNPASPTQCCFGAMPIRSTGRTARSGRVNRGSNPRWAALPPRTAAVPISYIGWPGSAPGGGSTCSYSNFGREASPRCWMLRVRIPPSARLLSDNGKHASPVRRQPGFDSPSRLARGCSSVRSEHLPATEKVARSNRVSRSHALVVEVR
jgi:hypothetical protein